MKVLKCEVKGYEGVVIQLKKETAICLIDEELVEVYLKNVKIKDEIKLYSIKDYKRDFVKLKKLEDKSKLLDKKMDELALVWDNSKKTESLRMKLIKKSDTIESNLDIINNEINKLYEKFFYSEEE